MAVRSDWPELTAIIDKALAAIDHEKHNEIKQKWIAVRYEHGIRRADLIKHVLVVFAAAAAALMIILLWAFRLRREIRQRKEAETALNRRESELRTSVKERELLIREVYHRVKNNLVLVSGLVQMQAEELTNPEDTAKMSEVTKRIRSLILLHEKLSLASDLKTIDISGYAAGLLDSIERARFDQLRDVHIRLRSVSSVFNERILLPVGLIINELVTNALKYGFETGQKGLIEVIIEEPAEGCLTLTVKNNGKPIPDEYDLGKPETLGLILVTNLVFQLGGELSLVKAPHPEFTVAFCRDGN